MEKKQLLEAEHVMRHLQRKLEEIIHILLSIVLSRTIKTFKNFLWVKHKFYDGQVTLGFLILWLYITEHKY